jgi:hypothetical protein
MTPEELRSRPTLIPDLNNLRFRRQFILGPAPFAPNPYWSCMRLGELFLSVHRDLRCASTTQANGVVVLLGHAVDPFRADRDEQAIVDVLGSATWNIAQLISATSALAGRWLVIAQNREGSYIFADACGMRRCAYLAEGTGIWCASEPELIGANTPLALTADEDVRQFVSHPAHAKHQSAWVGNQTIYQGVLRLMPNHYLDVGQRRQIRHYPHAQIQPQDPAPLIERATAILRGAMTAITQRHKVSLGVTAGWDSRLMVAASRHVKDRIEYFTWQKSDMPDHHPDIVVPKKLAQALRLNFAIRPAPNVFPAWFISILAQNVTATILPKTGNIYAQLLASQDQINLNGNTSEVARNYYYDRSGRGQDELSSQRMAMLLLHSEEVTAYPVRQIEEWKRGLSCPLDGPAMLDFLYWEQRMGGWCGQYFAEQDIAMDVFQPFNCRVLLEALLACPRSMRSRPDYPLYRELIVRLWPEAMQVPINPSNLPFRVRRKLGRLIQGERQGA